MAVNKKIPTSCKTDLLTGQQFIDLLPAIELLTDGLIFIGSLSHVILTSQCQNVVPILGLDGRDPSSGQKNCCCPRTQSITVYHSTLSMWCPCIELITWVDAISMIYSRIRHVQCNTGALIWWIPRRILKTIEQNKKMRILDPNS